MKSKIAQFNKYLLVFFSLLCFLGSISSITQVNFADSSKDKQKREKSRSEEHKHKEASLPNKTKSQKSPNLLLKKTI